MVMILWDIHLPVKERLISTTLMQSLSGARHSQVADEPGLPEDLVKAMVEMELKELEEQRIFTHSIPFSAIETFPTGILLSTHVTLGNELLLVQSESRIMANSLLVSPVDRMLVGRVQETFGNQALFIPVWSNRFFAQVLVRSGQGIEDQAFLEGGIVMNYNTAFSFHTGDVVLFSDYEPGGFSLRRYGWDSLGTIGSLLGKGVVETYSLELKSSREKALRHRYFLIIQ